MCLGCAIASLGLAWESKEAQEVIQTAIGQQDYCPKHYGGFSPSYHPKEHVYSVPCNDC